MGFAKYNEDIASRFNNDNYRGKSPSVRSKPKSKSKGKQMEKTPKTVAKPTEKSREAAKPKDKLKEFTVAAARPLPVVVLADVSGSMGVDGKIQALNLAVREMLEAFKDEADLRAEIHVSVITFGGTAKVHLPLSSASDASWTDLTAAGGTPLGAAFDLARQLVEDRNAVPARAYRPTIVLVSDGQPTPPGSEAEPLRQLLASERASKAIRMALAIGADADHAVLQKFLADPEARVYRADEARQIRKFFELVTMSVSARSRSANPNVAAPAVDPNGGWDL